MWRRLGLWVHDKRVISHGLFVVFMVVLVIAVLVELRLVYYGPGSANVHPPDVGAALVHYSD